MGKYPATSIYANQIRDSVLPSPREKRRRPIIYNGKRSYSSPIQFVSTCAGLTTSKRESDL